MELKPACRHFWLIDEADGETSKGKCKFCGEEKQFINNAFESHVRFAELPIATFGLASEARKIGRHGFRMAS
jgi:hypothetical protein